jgi:hypothetical protein
MIHHRPIALLTAFSEVLVKITYNRLSHDMQINNILVPKQFGFWKGTSTQNSAFSKTKRCMMEEYSMILAEAFDGVNHKILLTNYTFMAVMDQPQMGSHPI